MTRWPTLIELSDVDAQGDARPSAVPSGIRVLDQTQLPAQAQLRTLTTLADVAEAISVMRVRGAPLIGVTAAYGVALALRDDASDATLSNALAVLAATRPTAVNLHWALARMERVLAKSALVRRRFVAWDEARRIANEDRAANAAIGQHGAQLLAPIVTRLHGQRPVQLMTHCNAGRLATVEHGTALAPIYTLHAHGVPVHVWVSETRPRNQGWLSAWELAEAGVPHTLIADNAAGLLLQQGRVDAVIVGADRIAANGDVANKIGTYLKALAARAAGVPFYVAAPRSTIDAACPDGAAIPIEERSADELAAGATPVHNPAFDITPAALIDAIITEHGVSSPAQVAGVDAPH
jgi:methylthioribose-1-phosphate isomerase